MTAPARERDVVLGDLCERCHLPTVLDWLRAEGAVSVERLARLAAGLASPMAIAAYGRGWTADLLGLLVRGGCGRVEHDGHGRLLLVAAERLPSPDEAFERAEASWPPEPSD